MKQHKRARIALEVETLETREMLSVAAPPVTVISHENFDKSAVGTLPVGWAQWSSQGAFAVNANNGTGASQSLDVNGDSSLIGRAWLDQAQPANLQANAAFFLDSLVPGQLLARGSHLDTATPTYYAVSVTRGVQVQLTRTVNGVTSTLGHLQSAAYLSGVWTEVSLQIDGSNLQVFLQRLDTGAYLTSRGQWQRGPVAALNINDSVIHGGGQVGLGRTSGIAGQMSFDNFVVLGVTPSSGRVPVYVQESFDRTSATLLPAGWSQWSNEGAFFVSNQQSLTGRNDLAANGARGEDDRAWLKTPAPADTQVSAAVFVNSLDPAEVLLRGSRLNTAMPSYYAAAVTRGMQVELLRMADGNLSSLGLLQSNDYVSNQWLVVTLQATGSHLQVQVQRLDTNQYLASDGSWQSSPAIALSANDTAVRGSGLVGLARGNDYSGTVLFDSFSVAQPAAPLLTVDIASPQNGAVISHATSVQVSVSNYSQLDHVAFFVDNALQATDNTAPYSWVLDPGTLSDGLHTLTVMAYDRGGAVAQSALTVTTSNTGTVQRVNIPRHYHHIRIAELAYSGTVLGAFEQNLLRNSIDLVIPNTAYLRDIDSISPKTPQLIYTNVSSIYQNLLTDWLNWADAHGINREAALYHVTTPTTITGRSSSSQPVTWFWGVYLGGQTVNFVDQTFASHDPAAPGVNFGGQGTSMYFGFPDPFREMNFSLAAGASGGWSAALEYATGVDASGLPTGWAPLRTLSDGTNGLTRSGQITFDPPSNWEPVSVNGGARMFYVRFRTVVDGNAPTANSILGRDYVNARRTNRGTIPIFDYAADKNHDGYLNDAEWAHRRPGMNARFVYETRLFQGVYGQMRPATNPSSPAFRRWAVDFYVRLLKGQPVADGLFVDNSNGKLPADPGAVIETVSSYSTDYGTLLNAIGQAISPHWLLANTSGGGTNADGVIQQNTGYFEEFAIRPLAHNWQQFEDVAGVIAHRAALRSPAPYAVLDSLPLGGSPTDPRTQIATLAYYYMVGDPVSTFLDFYGGFEPSSSWSRHWSKAVAFDVGQPVDSWSLFATGNDPAKTNLTYRIYQRFYTNALVLYKPLSHAQGANSDGTLASKTATTHSLGGRYRPLHADGTLGSPITSITLRNGEGAILVKV